MDKVLAWHFLRKDKTLLFSPYTLVEPGQVVTAVWYFPAAKRVCLKLPSSSSVI